MGLVHRHAAEPPLPDVAGALQRRVVHSAIGGISRPSAASPRPALPTDLRSAADHGNMAAWHRRSGRGQVPGLSGWREGGLPRSGDGPPGRTGGGGPRARACGRRPSGRVGEGFTHRCMRRGLCRHRAPPSPPAAADASRREACTAIASSSTGRCSSSPCCSASPWCRSSSSGSSPATPARILLGVRATQKAIDAIHHQYGLDQPIMVQFFYFLANLAHGELGRSIIYRAPVLGVVMERIAPTAFLVGYAVVASILISLPLAGLAATRHGRAPDQAIRLFSTIGFGLPAFWLGIMLIMLLQQPARALSGVGLRRGVSRPPLPSLPAGLDAGAVAGPGADPQPARQPDRRGRGGLRDGGARQGPAGPRRLPRTTSSATRCCRASTCSASMSAG